MKILASLLLAAFTLAHGVLSFSPPDIPLNWTTLYPCAEDNPSRVLTGVVTTQYNDNTPASCIERCDAAGFAYAGVEYSNECHCGTGLQGTPPSTPVSECNLPCTGDSNLSCGGSWRIQIYKSPALPPGAWSLQGCFVDTTASPAFGPPVVHHTFATNLDLVGQCINYCEHIGYPFAGVENAIDCQCSFGYAGGVLRAPDDDCNSLCPLPPGAGNQICGGFERLMVYEYQF